MTCRSAHKRLWIAAGMLSMILTSIGQGCHDADRYVLTSDSSVSVEQLFILTVQGDSVQKADGFSHVRLVAQVMDVSEGGRLVLFTTTAGSLRVGDRTRVDSLSVETDHGGEAAVDLIRPSEAAVAQVTATVEAVIPVLMQQCIIRFTLATAEDMLSFEGVLDTVMLGASSRTEIQVRIDPSLEGEDRRVTFSSNLGRFLFGSGKERETRTVLADEDGVAKVTLVSPDAGGEAVVTATVRGFSLEKTIRFLAEPSITFLGSQTSAPADGFTLTRLSVEISSELEGEENRSVEFVTTAGTLVSGDEEGRRLSLVAGVRDTAVIFLRSPNQVGVAVVTASLKGASDERSINFDLASPDSVFVTIDP